MRKERQQTNSSFFYIIVVYRCKQKQRTFLERGKETMKKQTIKKATHHYEYKLYEDAKLIRVIEYYTSCIGEKESRSIVQCYHFDKFTDTIEEVYQWIKDRFNVTDDQIEVA